MRSVDRFTFSESGDDRVVRATSKKCKHCHSRFWRMIDETPTDYGRREHCAKCLKTSADRGGRLPGRPRTLGAASTFGDPKRSRWICRECGLVVYSDEYQDEPGSEKEVSWLVAKERHGDCEGKICFRTSTIKTRKYTRARNTRAKRMTGGYM